MKFTIPEHVHFSSEDEGIDDESIESYVSSEEEETIPLFSSLKNYIHEFFYFTHMENTNDHDTYIKHYVALLNLLGTIHNNKVVYIWNNRNLFHKNDLFYENLKEKIKIHISKLKTNDSYLCKHSFDTEDIVNEFYIKLNHVHYENIKNIEELKCCLNTSNKDKFKDKIHNNCIFKALLMSNNIS